MRLEYLLDDCVSTGGIASFPTTTLFKPKKRKKRKRLTEETDNNIYQNYFKNLSRYGNYFGWVDKDGEAFYGKKLFAHTSVITYLNKNFEVSASYQGAYDAGYVRFTIIPAISEIGIGAELTLTHKNINLIKEVIKHAPINISIVYIDSVGNYRLQDKSAIENFIDHGILPPPIRV